ncbi:M48 family metallopeptidase [Natronospirillum operosum]|uniref:M48 family metallopeptidase n=1 Tax=Natronospirillum operosum TaxID=2759953 RepID=A0A4Z0WJL2_9GAMM|nr:M48 family metallopeptidase [Natronospirillum operosum]TGG95987.1 M48 family metallopeptidase [Natronospirillum operosum]
MPSTSASDARPDNLNGEWYPAGSSQQHRARLQLQDAEQLVVVDADSGVELARAPAADWQFGDRLGHTTRFLGHPEGGRFATKNQDAVDALQRRFRPSLLTSVVHRLESHKRFIALTVLLVVAFGWSMLTWGIPALAGVMAERVPRAAVEQLTRETLAVADRAWFEESQLDEDEEQRLREHFAPIKADHPDLQLRLLFRQGGPLGANAVALPDGTMIMTDELVALAEHDDELTAILLHEIGHIAHNHGLQGLIQSSIIGIAFVLLTGDASATAEILLGAPLIINELSYSRRAEFEADDFARDYMLANDIPLAHFHNILWRLSYGASFDPEADLADRRGDSPWSRYLTTHPPTPERIERFQAP